MKLHKSVQICVVVVLLILTIACSFTAKADYEKALIENLNAYSDAFIAFAGTMQNVEINSQKLNDPSWVADVKSKLEGIKAAGDALGSMQDVPEDYQSVDGLMKMINQETDVMVSNFTQGLDAQDISLIETANENMLKIREYMDDAAAQIESMQ